MKLFRKLISGLFGQAMTKDQSISDFGRQQGYLLMLQTRLSELAPNMRACLDSLDISKLPSGTERLHLEIFQPGFEIRLFATDLDFQELYDPDSTADELERINAELDSFPPILNEDDLDRFIVWEDDPEHGRQEALEQPIDRADLSKPFGPFAAHVLEGVQNRFNGIVTAGFHDHKPDLLDHC